MYLTFSDEPREYGLERSYPVQPPWDAARAQWLDISRTQIHRVADEIIPRRRCQPML